MAKWNWVVYIFNRRMGWKGRLIASLMMGAAAFVGFWSWVSRGGDVSKFYENIWLAIAILWLLPALVVFFLLSHRPRMDNWGVYPWWLYEK